MQDIALKPSGESRRVGVEIELSGLDIGQISALIQDVVGGQLIEVSTYEHHIVNTSVGKVRVEFDALLFREMKIRNFFEQLQIDLDSKDKESIEEALASVAQWLVPFELVFEPIAIARLAELEAVRAHIGQYAEGTNSALLNAFGLHLNPEIPELTVEMALRYLRAFLVLYEELKHGHDVDPIRNLSGFIESFPKDYVLLVLDTNYAPSQEQFIDDYLTANPTRNRPLDLLPLLSQMDEERVRARLPEEKISPRPAFHYRLPNSLVNEEDWSISREWALWMKVEVLAHNTTQLNRRCRYKTKRLQGPFWYWLRRAWRTKPLLSRKACIAVTGPDEGGFLAWICTWLAIRRAGGRAIRLTPSQFLDDPFLPPFDGLILGGGADLDPQHYGEELQEILRHESGATDRHPLIQMVSRLMAPLLFVLRSLFSLTASGVDRQRDEFEIDCLKKALREKLPILGICRGAQLLNIHFGGSLCDVSSFYAEADQASTLLPRHPIRLTDGTRLAQLLGRSNLGVNSLHKQTIDRLGEGLEVSALGEQGLVQGVEANSSNFVLGVQWHPEYLPTSRLQQRLFRGLVQEALSSKR